MLAAGPVAYAGKVSAQVLCGVIADGKVAVVVPTPDKRKLDQPISCAIHVDGAPAGTTLIAKMFTSAEGAMKHAGPITPDKDFEQVLQAADDYLSCSDFVITARVTNDDDKVLWESKLAVKQACPAGGSGKAAPPPPPPPKPAAPPPSNPVPADDSGIVDGDPEWAEGEIERAPADAREAIGEWTGSYGPMNHVFWESFPAGGVKVGKQTITRKNLGTLSEKAGSPYQLLQIMPRFGCKNESNAGTNPDGCHWGRWFSAVLSKTEVWVYNNDGHYYGPWPAAVFKKSGGKWVWTAVKQYDQGEP